MNIASHLCDLAGDQPCERHEKTIQHIGMGTEQDGIVPLSGHVAEQISSSASIPNLDTVVLGLMENALDASATSIDIDVDFQRGSCCVEDNGLGLHPRELAIDSGLGRRHYTSKSNDSRDSYGRMGTFLASVAALSTVSIVSRQRGRPGASSMIIHHSHRTANFPTSPSHLSLSKFEYGTRIWVHNLFGNMPVRVKQRAVSPSIRPTMDKRDFERLKLKLVALVMAAHKPISVSLGAITTDIPRLRLGDNPHGTVIRPLSAEGPGSSNGNDRRRTLHHFDIPFIDRLFRQIKAVQHGEISSMWTKLSARAAEISIQGAVCSQPAPTKRAQFISLGKRPLPDHLGKVALLDEINGLFASSTFGVSRDSRDQDGFSDSGNRHYRKGANASRHLQADIKDVEKWPIFYLRIIIESLHDLWGLETDVLLENLLKVVRVMMHNYLKSANFKPRPLHRSQHAKSEHTQSQHGVGPAPDRTDAFSSWSRIKSSGKSRPSSEACGKFLSVKAAQLHESSEASERHLAESRLFNSNGEEVFQWRNPQSGEIVYINGQTGAIVPRPSNCLSGTETITDSVRPSTAPTRLTRPVSRGFNTPSIGTWASDLLSKWENPVFPLPAHRAIPSISAQNSLSNQTIEGLRNDSAPARDSTNGLLDLSRIESTIRLSREDLTSGRVISQVDEKFILVSSHSNSGLLMLIDQHAADERIRFEGLLDRLHTTPAVNLAKPLVFEIPTGERQQFIDHASRLLVWGFRYGLDQGQDRDQSTSPRVCRLEVQQLPSAIAERCRLDPSLLIGFLRREVWRLQDDAHGQSTYPNPHGIHSSSHENAIVGQAEEADPTPQPPTSSMPPPPPELLEILASRACRSAIMFNDVLSVSEAEDLVRRLSKCRMPFQCAHGRPSAVPLLHLGSLNDAAGVECKNSAGEVLDNMRRNVSGGVVGEDGAVDTSGIGFIEAWKSWQAN